MKRRTLRFALRLWPLGLFWYRVTTFFTRAHRWPVKKADSISEVLDRLAFGTKYKPDPWKGRLDVLRHPGLVEKWIETGKAVGDCDEHAAYWCCVLAKSHLVQRAWFCTIQMIDKSTGKSAGHAFTVFRDAPSHRLSWIDYDWPTECLDWHEVMESVAYHYNATPVGMTYTLIRGVRRDDSLEFGESHLVYR